MPKANTAHWVEWNGSHCYLVFDLSWRVYVQLLHSIRWSSIEYMTHGSIPIQWGINRDKNYQSFDWYMFQLLTHMTARCLSSTLSDALADIISCDGCPDSYPERNALKPRCMNTITNGMCGMLSQGGIRRMAAITQSWATHSEQPGGATQDPGRWL